MTARFHAVVLCTWTLLLAGCAGPAQRGTTPATKDAPSPPIVAVVGIDEQEDAANQVVLARLKQPIKGTKEKHKLVNVIDSIRHQAKLNLVVNWAALDAAGIDVDTVVPALADASAEAMLGAVLKGAADPKSLDPVGFSVRDGIVFVSTTRDLTSHSTTRLYILPPAMLQPIGQAKRRSRPPVFDLNEALGSTRAAPQPPAAKDIDIDDPDDKVATSADLLDDLRTFLQDVTGKQSDWAMYGGELSQMHEINGVLVVRAGRETHAEIASMLTQLYQASSVPWLRKTEAEHLTTKADTARLAGRHIEALRLVEDAIFAEPSHVHALAMKKVLCDTLKQPFALPIAMSEVSEANDKPFANVGPPLSSDLAPPTPPADRGEKAILHRFEARLREPTSVDFEAIELVKVIDHFRHTTGVSFMVDWAALEKGGIDQHLPISLSLRNVRADVALNVVLNQASADAEKPAGFTIDQVVDADGKIAVIVSTIEQLRKTTHTRVYDIRDLLEWGTDDYSVRLLHGRHDMLSVASMRFEVNAKLGVEPMTVEEAATSIIEAIPLLVGKPDGWSNEGGEIASVKELNGNLIIKCPAAWHREVEQLLTNLRAARLLSTAALMRHRETLQLLQQADELRLSQRYPEAQRLIDKALRVDPQCDLALSMKQVIEETMARRRAAGK